jgi:protein-ribulosamine 3-kinase
MISADLAVNGLHPLLSFLLPTLIEIVIPRLLLPLESNGNSIIPTLIHGDLWERNIGIDKATNAIKIFDPGCLYAHNEMEFATWRCRWATYSRDEVYVEEYKKIVPPSEPVEEWGDRQRLYAVYANLVTSANHGGRAGEDREM